MVFPIFTLLVFARFAGVHDALLMPLLPSGRYVEEILKELKPFAPREVSLACNLAVSIWLGWFLKRARPLLLSSQLSRLEEPQEASVDAYVEQSAHRLRSFVDKVMEKEIDHVYDVHIDEAGLVFTRSHKISRPYLLSA
eukprot:g55272.t1